MEPRSSDGSVMRGKPVILMAIVGRAVPISAKLRARADKLYRMVKQRWTLRETPPWSDPSQVFTDTRKVDLFNDPRWDSSSYSSSRRTVAEEVIGSSDRTIGKVPAFWRVLVKRGLHSCG